MGLVTGTTVGGGFLGLPFYTKKLGYLPSNLLLVLSWLFLNIQAFIFIELCLDSMKLNQNDGEGLSIYTLAKERLGEAAAKFLSLLFFFLLNASIVSQVAKAGDVLQAVGALPRSAGTTLTAVAVGVLVFLSSPDLLERANTALTAGLLACFAALMALGLPAVDRRVLASTPPLGGGAGAWGLDRLLVTFPVLLQLLVFHEVLPVVCHRLGGRRSRGRARRAVALGSAVPLLMMLGWNTVAFGLAGAAGGGGGGGGDPFDALLRDPLVGLVCRGLAFTAILTTTLGGHLALRQFFQDLLPPPGKGAAAVAAAGGPAPGAGRRAAAARSALLYLLTVGPSLLLALAGPGAFYAAVEFAGAYPVVD